MAKHLAEGRAFPLFTYGQRYILAVSVWAAAPFVALLGPTVFAMKLPILLANLAVAALLATRLVRDGGVEPRLAFAAALPFALPPVPIAAQLTEHAGGNVEPFFWILLLWVLRRRPVPFGLVAGIGYLNREFTAYGVVALVLLQVARGEWRRLSALRAWAVALAVAAASVAAIHLLRPWSTYPGERNAAVEWQGFTAAGQRLVALFDHLLPALFGLQATALASLNIGSTLTTGRLGAVVAPVAAAAAALAVARLARTVWKARPLPPTADFPVFLVLVGLQCLGAYVLVGIGLGASAYVRYLLLGLLGVAGAAGLFFEREESRPARIAVAAGLAAWAAANGVDHGRLAWEYATARPPNPYRELADDLVARGIRYGAADYWIAYHATYLAGERVRLDARGLSRDPEYRRLFRENLAEAVDVRYTGAPCPGRPVAGSFCVVGPPAPLRRVPKPGAAPAGGR